MWYGYVGPDLKTVFPSFKPIERLRILYPYSAYKKFDSEGAAWDWVQKRGSRKLFSNVRKYGDIFDHHYVTVEYFIQPDCVCYNIKTKDIGYIKVVSQDPDVSIENRTDVIKVRIRGLELNNDLIISHMIAIYQVLNLLGTFVDVELCVPDHSIFYALTRYTGSDRRLNKVLKYMKERKGNFAVTMKNYS